MKIELPIEVKTVLNILNKNKYQAFLVGGAMRSILLNEEPKDYDICTSAKPNEVMQCFDDYRIIETGLQHGTVTILINDMPIEVTTFRIDGDYSDNRKPDSVMFTDDLKQDISRRDFTINSLCYNPKDCIIDFYDGTIDLYNKIIKCIGNPDNRFKEDGLRILRALRFASVLGFTIDKDTHDAIFRNKDLLHNISKERITSEFNKLLTGKDCIKILREYVDIISVFIPELKPCIRFEQNNSWHMYDVWEHTLHAMESSENDLIIRLSLLLHDIGKPSCYSIDEDGRGHFYGHAVESERIAHEILKRLRYDNATIDLVCKLIGHHDVKFVSNPKNVKRLLNTLGEDVLRQLIQVRIGDIKAHSDKSYYQLPIIAEIEQEMIPKIIAEQQCFSMKDLAVNGKDLINLGFKQGIELGDALKYLLDLVINDEIENDKEKLLKKVMELKEKA